LPRSSWPPVEGARRREVKLRLNDDEMEEFQRRAELAKRSPAEYLRLIVLGEIAPTGEARQEAAAA
jgi:hypothetical protein